MFRKIAEAMSPSVRVKKIYLNNSGSSALTIQDNFVYLSDSQSPIIEIKGNAIYPANSSSAILKVKGNFVYSVNSDSVILKIKGNSVYPVSGPLAIMKIKATSVSAHGGAALKKFTEFRLRIYKSDGSNVLYKSSDKLNNIELITVLYQLGEIPMNT